MAHKRTFTLPASQVRPSDRNFAGADPHHVKPMRRAKKPGVATDRRIGNATSQGTYNGAEVCMPALRTGADDALQVPSRINDRLYFRDGRVTDLHGQPLQPHHE